MNGQERIDSLWAFIVGDDDGTEGPAMRVGDVAYPTAVCHPSSRCLSDQ